MINKNLLFSTLLLTSTVCSQNAMASSSFDSEATISYTISASNQNTGGSLIDLLLDETQPFLDIDAPSLSSQGSQTPDIFSDYSVSYSQSFQAQDNIIGGNAESEYLWSYSLYLENSSSDANDIFNITIDIDYQLTATASGQYADTDVVFEYESEDGAISDDDYVNASISSLIVNTPNSQNDTRSISFSLASGEYVDLIFDTSITGTLEATVVPVPAGIWLFTSALLAFPGIRKFKKA